MHLLCASGPFGGQHTPRAARAGKGRPNASRPGLARGRRIKSPAVHIRPGPPAEAGAAAAAAAADAGCCKQPPVPGAAARAIRLLQGRQKHGRCRLAAGGLAFRGPRAGRSRAHQTRKTPFFLLILPPFITARRRARRFGPSWPRRPWRGLRRTGCWWGPAARSRPGPVRPRDGNIISAAPPPPHPPLYLTLS